MNVGKIMRIFFSCIQNIAMSAVFWVLTITSAMAGSSNPLHELGSVSMVAASSCTTLRDLVIPGLEVKSSKVVSADDGAPEYCRVTGKIDRARFELRLPTEKWNGKYYMSGCGTLCGVVGIDTPDFKLGISRGYATITTDAGHKSWTPAGSKWAREDSQARTDHAWYAVHRAAVVGRQVTQAYYEANVKFSYFNGCSNGGRQGLMEAARFPDDFDGIIAEAPAQSGLANVMVWTYVELADTGSDGKQIFDHQKLPLLQAAVAKECGDASGVVSDPQACSFDPATLQCEGSTQNCLSAEEVRIARAWYAGPPKSTAYKALGGLPYGSEMFWTPRTSITLLDRMVWKFVPAPPIDTPLASLKGGATLMLRDVLSTPAFNSDYTAKDFIPERDLPRLKKFADEMTPSRDLTDFRARGGKLLITQGTADTVIQPAYTLDYWRETRQRLGDNADETLRMFMIPGMGHCGNGIGPQLPGYDVGDYDPLAALENWVERGVAPIALIATRRDGSGRITRTEKLCALPTRAVYAGSGDRELPESWVCR